MKTESRHGRDKDNLYIFMGKVPEARRLLPLSLQHVLAAVVGIIMPSLIVAEACDLSDAEKMIMQQAALILSAVATILQLFPLFGKIGAGLPVIMGSSFAFVSTMSANGEKFDIGTILGAEIIGGMVAIVFGLFVRKIRKLYDQQKCMYDNKTDRVENRIVSLHMPFIRPIVRGKTPNPTEFGPKMGISLDAENNSRVEYYSYEAYNESRHLINAIESYYARTGHYPERVLADQIYRNKENRKYCANRNIRISGPKLGRPSIDTVESKLEKKQAHQDMIDRIEVERCFSRSKRCFGLGLIMEKLEETVGSSATLGILLDNLIPVGF